MIPIWQEKIVACQLGISSSPGVFSFGSHNRMHVTWGQRSGSRDAHMEPTHFLQVKRKSVTGDLSS